MKLLLAICASLLMAAWTCEAFAATATGPFNVDFASDPACSATVRSDCIDHFEAWDVSNSPKKLAIIALPSPIVLHLNN